MTSQAVFGFAVYVVINAFTPGPGNLLALNMTANYGLKKSKSLLLGIFFGYYVVQILCAVFVFGLDTHLSSFMSVVRYIGVAYIVWLALCIARSSPEENNFAKNPAFLTGFILQFVNIKIFLFGISALTLYITPYYTSFHALLLAEIIIATVGTIATMLWAFAGEILQNLYQKYFRVINIIMSIALLQCAANILIGE